MVSDLKRVAPEIDVMQFRFDQSRPDLSKLDNVFGLLSAETGAFTKKIDEMEQYFINGNIEEAIALLKL